MSLKRNQPDTVCQETSLESRQWNDAALIWTCCTGVLRWWAGIMCPEQHLESPASLGPLALLSGAGISSLIWSSTGGLMLAYPILIKKTFFFSVFFFCIYHISNYIIIMANCHYVSIKYINYDIILFWMKPEKMFPRMQLCHFLRLSVWVVSHCV